MSENKEIKQNAENDQGGKKSNPWWFLGLILTICFLTLGAMSFLIITMIKEEASKKAVETVQHVQDVSIIPPLVIPEFPIPPMESESLLEKVNKTNHWENRVFQDEMRGKSIKYTFNTSINTLDLEPPYENSKMRILLREQEDGKQVVLSVTGQFVCYVGDVCAMNVRFDDLPVETFKYQKMETASNAHIEIIDAENFIQKLKQSKKTIVEGRLFRVGSVQYTFNTEGLIFN